MKSLRVLDRLLDLHLRISVLVDLQMQGHQMAQNFTNRFAMLASTPFTG